MSCVTMDLSLGMPVEITIDDILSPYGRYWTVFNA
jgi:hypothetical protein